MKKSIAIFLMCIFALAFTAVRATDTSPGAHKYSIEKVSLQASPVIVAVPSTVPVAKASVTTANTVNKEIFTISSFMEKTVPGKIHYSPGWPQERTLLISSPTYRIKDFSSARLIPYSRDRS